MKPSDETAKYLIRVLRHFDDTYAKGKPVVSDTFYDYLYQIVKKQLPQHAYFHTVNAPRINGRKEIKLPVLMRSLHKKTPADVAKWFTKEKLTTEQFVVTPKIDGTAIGLEYNKGKFVRAFTRGGDGKHGFDVTQAVLKMPNVIKRIAPIARLTIIGEVTMTKAVFAKWEKNKQLKKQYKSPRNLGTATILRVHFDKISTAILRDMEVLAHGLVMHVDGNQHYHKTKYDELQALRTYGFKTVNSLLQHQRAIPAHQITETMLTKCIVSWRERLDYLLDGVVLEVNDEKRRLKMDFYEIRPGYAYAIKADPKDQESLPGEIAKIELNMTARRIFAPVAVLKKPLRLDGADVQRISLFNYEQVQEKKLGPGALVKVVRSGAIIPTITETLKPAKFDWPKKCPTCDTKLKVIGVNLVCPNKKCAGPVERKLRHFFTVLKVDGLDKVTINSLVKLGFSTPAKVLQIDKKTLAKIPGFGAKRIASLYNGLNELKTSIDLVKLMHASGEFADESFGIGKERFRPIIEKLTQATILTGSMTPETMQAKLLQIRGIGPNVAANFVKALPAFRKFYNSLGIKLAKPKRGKLTGKKFVWTNFRDAEQEAFVEKHGGIISNTVSKDVTALFAAAKSTKTEKAEKLGVRVVDVNKAWKYLHEQVE